VKQAEQSISYYTSVFTAPKTKLPNIIYYSWAGQYSVAFINLCCLLDAVCDSRQLVCVFVSDREIYGHPRVCTQHHTVLHKRHAQSIDQKSISTYSHSFVEIVFLIYVLVCVSHQDVSKKEYFYKANRNGVTLRFGPTAQI